MMPQENIEIANRWTAAINARQVPEELLAPDVLLENVTTAVTDRTYRGATGVREWISDFFDVLGDDARYEGEVIEAGDDYVVGKARFVGPGSVSGVPVEMRYYGVMWIRDGKITRAVGYPNRRDALEAVGLRE
jgi:ketosteroid isomerase-like protein